MRTKVFGLAAVVGVALAGAAHAQTPAGGGSAEGNINNPGSVKSNSEKMNERTNGSATGAPSTQTAPGVGTPPPGAGISSGATAPAR